MEHIGMDFPGEKPVINIYGEKVALGPVQKGMIADFIRWRNDFAVALMSGDPLGPVSQESVEESYTRHAQEGDSWMRMFAIYERASMRCIGTTHLRHINMVHRNAEYGILIGEKDCWGKGYGTETTTLVLDYAFTVLGLHNIILSTYSYNERAIRAYTRAGFRVIGRQREAARLGDQIYDVVFMDCLASEFRNPFKRVIELP